jgi:hypothetical protein
VQAKDRVFVTLEGIEGRYPWPRWFWKFAALIRSIVNKKGIKDHSGVAYLETMVDISKAVIGENPKAQAALASIKSALDTYRAGVDATDDAIKK